MTDASHRILIVVTSHDRLGDTGRPTGFFYEEMAAPYWVFTDAGYDVDIASPRGGMAPHDPKSLAEDETQRPEAVRRFLADGRAAAKIESTIRLDRVDPDAYAAIFLAGGHGTMWDFPANATLARLVGRLLDRGRVVGAVCHGPSGLVGATLADGTPVVKGRRVDSFTDEEERAVELDRVVPFLLETRLRDLGGRFEGAGKFQAHAVRDGSLVTGQNPPSSVRTAELVLEAIRASDLAEAG